MKKTPFRKRLKKVAKEKVVTAQVMVSNALLKVETGDEKVLETSDTASMTKIAEVKVEKISSVKPKGLAQPTTE